MIFCVENLPLDRQFPTQDINAAFWYFICLWAEQDFEQAVTWDAIIIMWCDCYVYRQSYDMFHKH